MGSASHKQGNRSHSGRFYYLLTFGTPKEEGTPWGLLVKPDLSDEDNIQVGGCGKAFYVVRFTWDRTIAN